MTQVWCFMPIISEPGKLSQKDRHKFNASLDYIVGSRTVYNETFPLNIKQSEVGGYPRASS